MRTGSTSTWYCSRCSPQIATLATPGTLRSRALIFQYPIVERRWIESVFEETPIFTTRAVVDAGGMMNGGAAHVGNEGVSDVTRSCTSCLAWRMSTPGSNCSSIDDSCGTDLERIR